MRQFRLYPEPGSPLYFEVRIYRSKRLMQQGMVRNDRFLGLRCDWSHTLALSRSFETQKYVKKRWVSHPRLGVLFFPRRYLGIGLVAHELAHAAVRWAARVGLRGSQVWDRSRSVFESKANERFAQVVGELNRQFWRKFSNEE